MFGRADRRSPGCAASRTGHCGLAEQRRTLCVARSLSPSRREAFRWPHSRWLLDLSVSRMELRFLRAMRADPRAPLAASAGARTRHRLSHHGKIWPDLGVSGDTQEGVTLFSEWDDVSFRKVGAGPYLFRAHGPRVIENFLDVGHFPFVHAGFLGDPGHTEVGDYEVETTFDGIVARDIGVWQPDPDGTGQSAEVKYTYRVLRPLTAYFLKSHQDQKFSIFSCVTPVDERESVAWMIMAINYASQTSDEQLRKFQDVVSGQDIPIVESQRPELLPLDLQAELHLRSDRTAIAYRQWLKKIGLKYGTA